jgi:hypothetical protein
MSAPESQDRRWDRRGTDGSVLAGQIRGGCRRPQEAHADLGLIDDDHTPDMRPGPQPDVS